MRIKTKISLGLVFLFFLIFSLAFLGIYNLHRIANDMKGILSDNYRSVGYTKNMLQELDEIIDSCQLIPTDVGNSLRAIDKLSTINYQLSTKKTDNPQLSTILSVFEKNLANQEKNITEKGEKELTASVRFNFESMKKAISGKTKDSVSYYISTLNKILYKISDLNSNAMLTKNNEATKKAENGIFFVSIVAAFCLLTSFTLLINFPSFIANPIKELTAGIREIADRNYEQRLHFKSNDEFGDVAKAFNSMASRLHEYQNTTLAKILLEKSRLEIILDKMKYPIFSIDQNNKILFVNQTATLILGLSKQELIDKLAPEIALRNDLLRTIISYPPTIELNTDSPKLKVDKSIKIFFENKGRLFKIQTIDIVLENENIGKAYFLMVND